MRRDEDRDPGPLDGARHEARIVELVVPTPEGRPLLAHQQADDLDGLLEPVDPLRSRRQVDAVAAVLVLVPPGADPEDQSPAADVVDGDRLLEQDRGMPERVARHEHAQADARRLRRDRREQGPCLVAAVLGAAIRVDQVVHEPRMVEAELLRLEEIVEHLVPALARLAEEEPETQAGWVGHCRCSRLRYRWMSTTTIRNTPLTTCW